MAKECKTCKGQGTRKATCIVCAGKDSNCWNCGGTEKRVPCSDCGGRGEK